MEVLSCTLVGDGMTKKNLRFSTNINELSKDIKAILGDNAGFTIWQNINGEKILIPGILNSQFLSNTELTVEFEVIDGKKMRTQTKVFMFCESSGILLKGRIRKIAKSKLRVVIDHKFYLREKRLIARVDLSDKGYHIVIDRKVELKNKVKTEDVKLKNVSNFGCGFYVTSNRAVFFQPGSEICVKSLANIPFKYKVNAVITHITPTDVDFDSNKLMLVGIRFDEEYSGINQLIQKVELAKIEKPDQSASKVINQK